MLTVSISDALGGDGKLTEDKKTMPNQNDYKKTCVAKIKEVEDMLEQQAQEDVKDVVTYLDMAIDILSGNKKDDNEDAGDEDITSMNETKKKGSIAEED